MNYEIRVQTAPWYAGYVFRLKQGEYVAKNIEFERMQEGACLSSHNEFEMSQENAQLLMNDLWHMGLRPSDGTGSAGQLKATELHLADMRNIALKLINFELEGGVAHRIDKTTERWAR